MGYDALIVGARCAGSTLAVSLARAGKKVLLVDAAELPSDQPLSTHVLSIYAMSLLDALGLGDRVRAVAPPFDAVEMGMDDEVGVMDFPPEARPTCPRRADLDAILLDAAREAGAEVRVRTKVVDVVRERGRVVGVITEHDGQPTEIRAEIVVGADGMRSTLAARVGAKAYHVSTPERAAYWGYVERPDWYDGRGALVWVGDVIYLVFPANADQIMLCVSVPKTRMPEWVGDKRAHLNEYLRRVPRYARFAECKPVGKMISFVTGDVFFREAAGPGWALVGDAGLFLDPTPGLGITDAFRDAAALAAAILEGTDLALERYWRERDALTFELFEYANDLSRVEYNNPLSKAAIAAMVGNAEYRQRWREMSMRRLPPSEILPPSALLKCVLRELLRGRFAILRHFFTAVKRANATKKELERMKALVPAPPAHADKPTTARSPDLPRPARAA